MTTTEHSGAEERANSLSHGIGAVFSLLALVVLVLSARKTGDPLIVFAYALFGASLILLFTASSVYHGAVRPALKKKLRVLDHASIYVLIAGTYSSFCLTALRGTVGWLVFGVVWSIAIAGVVLAFFFTGRFKVLSTSGYVLMGWIIVFAFGQLKANLAPEALFLLMLGGGLYTLGAVVYAIKRIPWNHPIWHLFVIGGAACHVFAALKALA